MRIRWSMLAGATALVTAALSGGAAAAPPSPAPDATIAKAITRFPGLARLSCAGAANLALPGAHVTYAGLVSSGSFTIPGTATTLTGLPEFCRVVAVANPTPDSVITIELWAPTTAYRNRYLQVGNGGFSGAVVYAALADGVRRGYAAASTDDGNQTPGSAAFAMGHPEKIVDYGWRSLRETAEKSKAILRALKGADPSRSYFNGCSNGGREALMVAQRFPAEFDGVVAGAPANNFTRQFAAFVWNAQRVYPAGAPPALAEPRLSIVSNFVRARCAGRDGGLAGDKFLTNPPACRPDPALPICDGGACLDASEATVVRAVWGGARRDDDGTEIYPGYEPGAESYKCNWGLWITGKPPGAEACGWPVPHFGFQSFFGWDFFRYFVYGAPGWDIHALTFSGALDALDAALGPTLNATDPDLAAFRARGGKLIQYHGWDDAAVAPRNSINYWSSVRSRLAPGGEGVDDFYRLFMAPGLSHCVAGPGLNSFGNAGMTVPYDADHDVMLALERWVEEGVAPDRIIARHAPEAGEPAFARPLCSYPRLPRYRGAGDPADAASWDCAAPRLLLRAPERVLRVPERIPREPPVVRPGG